METRYLLLGVTLAACGPSGSGVDGGADASFDSPSSDAKDSAADGPVEKCTPGLTRCTDDNVGTQTCDESGDWVSALTCTNQTCVKGQCAGLCAPGQGKCSGNDLEACDATGNYGAATPCADACCAGACVDTKTDANHCGACGNACGSGTTCGTSFTAFTGTQSASWAANGSASYDTGNNAARLTDTGMTEAGTWIYEHPIAIDDATIQFDFYAGDGAGNGDGLVFMLETNGATALGTTGGGFGAAGLTGFGVEMDTYNNAECGDVSANHTAIDALTACGDGSPTTLTENDSPGFTIADSTWHTVIVDIASGAFTVTANGTTQFSAYAPSGFTNGSYYLGFGAGTGGSTDNHLVRNVSVKFKTGHCY